MTRKYSSISVETTLAGAITNTTTSVTVASGTATTLLGGQTLAPGNVDQFTVAIDPDTTNEEIVFVTAVSGDTLTIVRARAGSSGIAHSSGATVRHVLTSNDLDYFRDGVTAAVTASSTNTFTNKTISGSSNTLTNIGNSALTNSSVTVGSTSVSLGSAATTVAGLTLTGATLTSPIENYPTLKSPQEITTVAATAATGTVNFDTQTQAVLYFTATASGNWTLNVRGDGSTTLNSLMDVGDSLTVTHLVTQGTTAYYNSAVTIDGSAQTVKWQNGLAPSAGNASSVDAYSYTIIKTASATYTVFASQNKFA
jgi:hypothetical protein